MSLEIPASGGALPAFHAHLLNSGERKEELAVLESRVEQLSTLLHESPVGKVKDFEAQIEALQGDITTLKERIQEIEDRSGLEKIRNAFTKSVKPELLEKLGNKMEAMNDTLVALDDSMKMEKKLKAAIREAEETMGNLRQTDSSMYRLTVGAEHYDALNTISRALRAAKVPIEERDTLNQVAGRLTATIKNLELLMQGFDDERAKASLTLVVTAEEKALLAQVLNIDVD